MQILVTVVLNGGMVHVLLERWGLVEVADQPHNRDFDQEENRGDYARSLQRALLSESISRRGSQVTDGHSRLLRHQISNLPVNSSMNVRSLRHQRTRTPSHDFDSNRPRCVLRLTQPLYACFPLVDLASSCKGCAWHGCTLDCSVQHPHRKWACSHIPLLLHKPCSNSHASSHNPCTAPVACRGLVHRVHSFQRHGGVLHHLQSFDGAIMRWLGGNKDRNDTSILEGYAEDDESPSSTT